jgi:hypothetical protein
MHKKCKRCWPTGEPGELAACTDQRKVLISPGRRCHSTMSLTVISCHSIGIYTVILLLLLSVSIKETMSTPGVERVWLGAAAPIMWEACHRRPEWPDGLPAYLVRCHHMWRAHAPEVRKAVGRERKVPSMNPFVD